MPGSQCVPARTAKPCCLRAIFFVAAERTELSPKNDACVMDAMFPYCVSVTGVRGVKNSRSVLH